MFFAKVYDFSFGFMNVQKHTSPTELKIKPAATYYTSQYLLAQSYPNLQLFSNSSFFVPVTIQSSDATTLERSPFGSYMSFSDGSLASFTSFEEEVVASLKTDGCTKMVARHPSPIYSDYVDREWLAKVGYAVIFEDINQHIDLTIGWEDRLHKMQLRKLKSLQEDGFSFQVISPRDIEIVHQFLTVCRLAQGLDINISLEKLRQLCDSLPNTYNFFGVYRESKLSAVCISVRVTNSIAYYYLAGTSPLFRSKSPMVLLISGMVAYYRNLGLKTLDLGVSSHEGRPQETLRLFKNRMGAIETKKPTFSKMIDS